MSLYRNINKRKKAGTSRSKKNSTISAKSYANMKAGFPKKEKKEKVMDGASMAPFFMDPKNYIKKSAKTSASSSPLVWRELDLPRNPHALSSA